MRHLRSLVTSKDAQHDANLPFGVPSNDPSSHILLAACRKDEHAYEDSEGGCFTKRLLDYLDPQGGRELTYSDIDRNLAVLNLRQHPLVLGGAAHMQRILFEIRCLEIKSGDDLQLSKLSDGSFRIDAGSFHGITNGALVVISFQDEEKVDRQVTATASEVNNFSSVIRLTDSDSIPNLDPSQAVASISTHGSPLKVWVGDKNLPTDDFRRFESDLSPFIQLVAKDDSESSFLIYVHQDEADPKIEVKYRHGESFWGSQCIRYGRGSNILHQLPRFLDALNHFHHHVNHFYPTEHLKISLHRLKEDGDGNRHVDSSICSDWRAGNTSTTLQAQTRYGLRVVNNSPYDLHFYLFYFYLDDFSIEVLIEFPLNVYLTQTVRPEGTLTGETFPLQRSVVSIRKEPER